MKTLKTGGAFGVSSGQSVGFLVSCLNAGVIGASKFSRRRIDLSRQVANKTATRRSVDYSNEYEISGWTPRPGGNTAGCLVVDREAKSWVKHSQQCAVLHLAKQLDETHLEHSRQIGPDVFYGGCWTPLLMAHGKEILL
ncbi:unnamed protein product [Cercopithifilaria johnstoni]|uniref:Uncharacterized protein n=1 Tax=Cercopithifilaria johnstoni TaxID=2874296 RepID=A0A8J2M6S5_9BILA|nr:unnamed protein product [Cercopithifilaria johnstoni]